MQAATRLSRMEGALGPHAGRLLAELLVALQSRQPATAVILAAAVLDVALREPSGPAARR